MNLRLFATTALLLAGSAPIHAQDASFGCKVLLCAAATAPSWSGIPYCVPPMTQLFSDLAKGRGWPSCPEGNTSGLGYEPYMPCPDGTVAFGTIPGVGDNGTDRLGQTPDGNQCAAPNALTQICSGSGDGQTCTPTLQSPIPRVPRTDANFVDITTGGQTQRFYFSLRRY